jgi:hypothetical protein
MATFDDITGWREELEVLRKSDVFKQVYSQKNLTSPYPKIPLSALFLYAETLLKHTETMDAFNALDNWRAQQTSDFVDTDNDPTFPFRAQQLLTDFRSWFILKTGHGPDDWAYARHGGFIARAVLNEMWPAVRSPQAIDYIRKNASTQVDATFKLVGEEKS